MKVEEVIDLARTAGILEPETLELSAEFYSRWKRLEIGLNKRGPVEKEWAGQGVDYESAARIGAIVSFFEKTGLHKDTLEQLFNLTVGITNTIPVVKPKQVGF